MSSKYPPMSNARCLGAAVLMFSMIGAAPASAQDRDFARVYDEIIRGEFVRTANSVMTCDRTRESAAHCDDIESTTGAITRNNNNTFTRWIDIDGVVDLDNDGDDDTYNSSAGNIDIPSTATVQWAALYWTTNNRGGNNRTNTAPGQPASRGEVLLDLPGGGYSYVSLTNDWTSSIGNYQTSFKDVTSLVQSVGTGNDLTFTVANVAANTGQDDFIGGWELFVVYEDPNLRVRSLTVHHGFKSYGSGSSSTFPLDGFIAPLNGPIAAELGISVTEGDKGSGDTASLNGTNVSNAISTASDMGDASIATPSGHLPGRNPAYRNTLSIDVDTFDVSGEINNGDTSATFVIGASSGEGNQFYKMDFAVDVYFPEVRTTKTATDVNGGDLVEGDELLYTITVENLPSSFDDAVNVVLTDVIPAGTTYKPGSMTLTSSVPMGPATGSLTDAANDDVGEYDASADQLLVTLGRGAMPAAGGTLEPGDSTTLTFVVTVDPLANAQDIVNEALVFYEGATLAASGTSNPTTSRSEDPVTGGPTTNPADPDPDGDGLGANDIDEDNDGITDAREYDGVDASLDSNNNKIADYKDPSIAGFVDSNNDGVDDRRDLDLDGVPNHLDLDADGDGIFDVVEGGGAAFDSNNNGRVDAGADADRDGLIDSVDPSENGSELTLPNSDNDGAPDFLDADDDNDGVLTLDEDIDGDGDARNDNTDAATGDILPDYLDADDDGDGVLSINEPGDADNSNTPDRLEPCTPNADSLACPAGDPDGDGTPNDMDPDPLDPCVPDPNALACDTGDTDGDTISNGDERNITGTNPNNADSDGDGLRDDFEVGADLNNPIDSDMDNSIDALDPDDDNDGVLTRNEDPNADGDPTNDNTDSDALPNYLDPDDDNDGVLTIDEDIDGDGDPSNDFSDGDALPDYLDTDDDGDAVLTVDEPGDADNSNTPDRLEPCTPNADSLACPSGDPDGDGTPNDMDPDPLDPCVPDASALACDGGDNDMDGLTNAQERDITGTDPNNADTDGDGVLDGVEVGADVNNPNNTDGDALIDALDPDDDGDGVPTADEDIDGDGDPTNDDTDSDTLPDYLDTDDDGDGVLTRDEDHDGDGDPANDNTDGILGDTTPDYLDVDDDGDGVLTEDEDVDMDGDLFDDDTNMDGAPNFLDPCDPDDMSTACAEGDTDGDGTPNGMDPDPSDPCVPDPNALACDTGDTDGDSIPNGVERDVTGTDPNNPDTDGDGLRDDFELGPDPMNPIDTDGDMTPDALDTDDDGDGILTRDEDPNGDGDLTNDDSDGDGLPDYLDEDDDGDGVPTADEDIDGDGDPTNDDSDGDTVPNYLDPDDDDDGVLTIDEDRDGDGNPANDNSDGILGDTTPDYLDVDDDGDGVLTEDEDVDMDGDPRNDDTNMDMVPNYLDPCDPDDSIRACLEGDTDLDGVPNNIDPDPLDPCNPDADALACPTGDTDMDGIPNQVERTIGTDPTLLDSDFDGIPDGVEVGPDVNNPIDTDMDGAIDALDPDDDGDGVLTVDEDLDMDGDPTNDDTDGDTVPNYLDPDDDGDSIPTRDEDLDQDGDASNDDSDGDTVPNYLDEDDDNDGVLTRFEDVDGDGDPTNDNTDAATGDTTPDYLDTDDDGDGILTQDEDADPDGDGDPSDALDSDMDNTPDYLDPDQGQGDEVTIVSPGDGTQVPTDVTVRGTSAPGATVEVYVDGELAGTATADADGDWELEVTLAAGTHTIAATDGAGNMSETITVEAVDGLVEEVAITSPTDGQTLDSATFTVSGSGTPNATVEVYIDGELTGTTTVDDEGNWSLDVTTTNGAHDITAKLGGATSEVVSVTVDDDSIGDGIAVSIGSPGDGEEVSPTPVISGQATPGAEVEVSIDGELVGTVTADAEGNWSFEVTTPLEEGDHTASAVASLDGDTAGSGEVGFTVVAEDVDPNEVEVLLRGGCSQSGGQPADGAWLLGALGLLALRRRKRREAA